MSNILAKLFDKYEHNKYETELRQLTETEIKNRIHYNIVIMRQKTFFSVLLALYSIFTPQVVQIARLNINEICFYEVFVVMGVGIVFPIVTIQMMRRHRENKILRKILDDMNIQ